jgi:hypothetical protein
MQPKYNKDGSINLEIEHKEFGLIQFTASPNDPEEHGRELYQRAVNGEFGKISPYESPSQEEIDAQNQAAINYEARKFLAETDWYVIRNQETGEHVPQEILEARQSARDSVIE